MDPNSQTSFGTKRQRTPSELEEGEYAPTNPPLDPKLAAWNSDESAREPTTKPNTDSELKAREVLYDLVKSRDNAVAEITRVQKECSDWYFYAMHLKERVRELSDALASIAKFAESSRGNRHEPEEHGKKYGEWSDPRRNRSLPPYAADGASEEANQRRSDTVVKYDERSDPRRNRSLPPYAADGASEEANQRRSDTVVKYDERSDPRCNHSFPPQHASLMSEHCAKEDLCSKMIEIRGFNCEENFGSFLGVRCYGIDLLGRDEKRDRYFVSFYTTAEARIACRRLDGCKVNGFLIRAFAITNEGDYKNGKVTWKRAGRVGAIKSYENAKALLAVDGKDSSEVDDFFFTSLRLENNRFLPENKGEIRDIVVSHGVRTVGHIAVPRGKGGIAIGIAYVHVLRVDAIKLIRIGDLDIPGYAGEKARVSCTPDTDLGPRAFL